jgi:preprotein translocase subunit SecG
LFIHIVVSFLLIIIVLLQSGKSADLAGAFGGMGSQSTFGPRGAATFLSKMTTTLAILFMVTSLVLYIGASRKGKPDSKLDNLKQKEQVTDTKKEKTDTPQKKKTEGEKKGPEQKKKTEGEKQGEESTGGNKKETENKTANR